MSVVSSAKGVAITNPLVLYRALVATHRLQPDEAQHRLAIHLQELYHRLKDYEPQKDYRQQLAEIRATLDLAGKANGEDALHAQRGLFARLRPAQSSSADTLALVRRFTSHESALHLDSPRGLLIHGEVGTGKSMLVDLLADALPTHRKRRYHFNTFMLDMLARLERLRLERRVVASHPARPLEETQSASLLMLARDLVAHSPILFLDEFQLPDRAAVRILTNLFTAFFHLGGVLVATSNRIPEELAQAAGVEFARPARRSSLSMVQRALFGPQNDRGRSEDMFASNSDSAQFLDVLKARCETWDMSSARDWRRVEMQGTAAATAPQGSPPDPLNLQPDGTGLEGIVPGNLGLGFEQSKAVEDSPAEGTDSLQRPVHYYISPPNADEDGSAAEWDQAVRTAISLEMGEPTTPDPILWTPATLRVYGRDVTIPRTLKRVCLWDFGELCITRLGPADYITMASNYNTFIITNVPILSLLQKNEARRFITLLDALYEARCKVLIRAQAGPDNIFFPETSSVSAAGAESHSEDTTYAETFGEIFQDQTAPFRPNVSSYAHTASEPSYASAPLPQADGAHAQADRSIRSILADEDSDFGPTYGAGRSSGAASRHYGSAADPVGQTPDFQRTGMFTGEDERFAYKRARSRLWEMCGAQWWNRRDEGWWKPLDPGVRHWERSVSVEPPDLSTPKEPARYDDTATELETSERSFDRVSSPFRTRTDPPPKISWTHAWGMTTWGKKAGAWGQGVAGLPPRSHKKDGGDKSE